MADALGDLLARAVAAGAFSGTQYAPFRRFSEKTQAEEPQSWQERIGFVSLPRLLPELFAKAEKGEVVWLAECCEGLAELPERGAVAVAGSEPNQGEGNGGTDSGSTRPAAKPGQGEGTAADGDGPKGFLGGADLADSLGIDPSRREAFGKRLERARTGKKLGDHVWREIENPPHNTPQFLYRADAPAIRAIAESYKWPKTV